VTRAFGAHCITKNGPSPFLIVADRAGNFMPRALGRLGLPESECEAHIAWDIGIAAVSGLVADALDATLVRQNYSRLRTWWQSRRSGLRDIHMDRGPQRRTWPDEMSVPGQTAKKSH